MTDNDGTIFTGKFWKETAERAIKSFAQGLLVTTGAGATNLLNVGWQQALAAAGAYTLASVLTSIVTATVKQQPTADATK
jgi:hypothetical protein